VLVGDPRELAHVFLGGDRAGGIPGRVHHERDGVVGDRRLDRGGVDREVVAQRDRDRFAPVSFVNASS